MATSANSETIEIGRVIERGFRTISRNFLPFLGLSLLLVALPGAVLQTLIGAEAPPDFYAQPQYWLSFLVSLLTGYLVQASLVRSAILDLNGRPPEIGRSLIVALTLLLPMIGLTIVSSFLIGFGFLLLIVPGIILYIMFIVAVPCLVEERGGVFRSMSRSRELTRGSRLAIFMLLVIFLFVYGLIYGMAGFAMGLTSVNELVSAIVVTTIAATLTTLLGATMLASLYVELRTVKEGATAEGLANIFE